MNIGSIREDFPVMRDLIYLDSAATSLSPESVIRAMNDFERRYRANVGRGVHRLSSFASHRYTEAHKKISAFIGGDSGTVAITKNTTEAINLVARGLHWEKGDRVVTTLLEHHSNLLPWLDLREQGVEVGIIRPDADGMIRASDFEEAIDGNTRLVAVTHVSNVLGSVLPVKEIARLCHECGARLLVDGAQSVPHMQVDAGAIGCDYLCFSGHKMLGPTGTGVLWMKKTDADPLIVGGGGIVSVTTEGYVMADDFRKYEAGTPNIGGTIGLAEAADYLTKIGMDNVRTYCAGLTDRLVRGLARIPGVSIFGPSNPEMRSAIVSFTVDGMHPHDVAHILDEAAGIMVRSGDHCCQPLMAHMNLNGTVRASPYIYNDTSDIDLLIDTVEEIARMG
ncbi:MAG: cysteine desulfurase [Methanoregulaceae archaeon]|nr:cysteine desulfurase [Methanoregulaceae archaeon]